MFRKLAFTLIASSLIAGPALAQTGGASVNTQTTAAPKAAITAPAATTGAAAKADVKANNTGVKADTKASATVKPAKKTKKHISSRKHGHKVVHVKKNKAHVAKVSKKIKTHNVRV